MSDEQRSNVKVQFVGAEMTGYMDSLQRIAESVKPYEKPMFVGGPLPSAVAMELHKQLADKLKDAPVIGAPPRNDQR